MARMIGSGPGCRMQRGSFQCDCCNTPPGKNRRSRRRNLKRRERNEWKNLVRRDLNFVSTDDEN